MVKFLKFTVLIIALCVAVSSFAGTKGELVDPMRPVHYRSGLAKKQVDTSSWQFTAVLTSSQRSVAVINQKSFKVGDTIEGYRVVKIDFDKVLLKNKRNTVVLHRVGTGLKKMSAQMDIGKGSNL